MSHGLELDNKGQGKAFFVGQPAWHNLGVVLENPPTIEEAIKAAQLDWKVKLSPLFVNQEEPQGEMDFQGVESKYVEVPSHFATVRESDNAVLGVVGKNFKPLQNEAAFKWFQPFLDTKEITLEAAGALHGGKRIWILAKLKPEFGGKATVIEGDDVEQYLVLAHAHDGSLAIRVGFTPVRVVCQNTLHSAIRSEGSKLLKIRHTENAPVALSLVRDIIDTTRRTFSANMDVFRILAATGCDEVTLKRYVREICEPGQKDNDEAYPRVVNQIVELFRSGTGAQLGKDTLWNAYNAVTEHITHKIGRDAGNRLDGQWFGKGAQTIERALEVALQIANGNF